LSNTDKKNTICFIESHSTLVCGSSFLFNEAYIKILKKGDLRVYGNRNEHIVEPEY